MKCLKVAVSCPVCAKWRRGSDWLWRNPKENFWPAIDRLQKGTGAEWDQAITLSVTTMFPSAPWSWKVGWTPWMIRCVPQGAGNLYSRASGAVRAAPIQDVPTSITFLRAVKQTSPNKRSSTGISADDRQMLADLEWQLKIPSHICLKPRRMPRCWNWHFSRKTHLEEASEKKFSQYQALVSDSQQAVEG